MALSWRRGKPSAPTSFPSAETARHGSGSRARSHAGRSLTISTLHQAAMLGPAAPFRSQGKRSRSNGLMLGTQRLPEPSACAFACRADVGPAGPCLQAWRQWVDTVLEPLLLGAALLLTGTVAVVQRLVRSRP